MVGWQNAAEVLGKDGLLVLALGFGFGVEEDRSLVLAVLAVKSGVL